MSKAKFIEVSKDLVSGIVMKLKTDFYTWYVSFDFDAKNNIFEGAIARYSKHGKEISKDYVNSNSFWKAIGNIANNKNIVVAETLDFEALEK